MKNRNYTPIYRIIHWAIAFCMLFLLLTIFLRLTWMNKNNMAEIMQDYFADKDVSMSRDELIALAKKIRKPMWNWHIYTGYVLTGLFCIRLILPFFGQMKFSDPFNKQLSRHEKFRSWVYLVFYVCVFASLFTGLMIRFGPDTLHELMEEIHVLSIYYLIAFLVVHFTGILWAEFTDEKGIISRIVSGKKREEK